MNDEEDCDEVVSMVVSVAAYVACVAVHYLESTAKEPSPTRGKEKSQTTKRQSKSTVVNGQVTNLPVRAAPLSVIGARETENQVDNGVGHQNGLNFDDFAGEDQFDFDIDDLVDIEDLVSDDELTTPDPRPAEPNTSSSISGQGDEPNSRKRKRISGGDPMIENLGSLATGINRIAYAMEERLRINKALDLSNLGQELKKIPDFSEELIIEASEYLASDEKLARIFFVLSEDQRRSWLLKRLGH